ncbi:MAG: acetyl-CoA carboxylase, carboxyltransferase subunit beta [Planctomycetota bacterium]
MEGQFMATWEGLKRFVFHRRREMPDGLWMQCDSCNNLIHKTAVAEKVQVCPECNYHFYILPQQRIDLILDRDSFDERWVNMESVDPLNFKAAKTYKDKLAEAQKITGIKDAVTTGKGTINGIPVVLAITDSRFLMGSMGSVLGEKITRTIELATSERLPVIIFSGSGGGARMEEGCISLMQMAKTSAALARHHDTGLLHISILTNPTMGGVMASFAGLGDIIMAEPRALIGFTGPRIIAQTIKQELPPGFQTSEFMLAHGMIDRIIERKTMKSDLTEILQYLSSTSIKN